MTELEFLTGYQKTFKIPNFIKIHPVGDVLFHVDGHMDEWMQEC